MLAQAHDDTGSIGLHTAAFDPMFVLGAFDDRSLFADCTSLSFEDFDVMAAKVLPTSAAHSPDCVDTTAQVFVDASLVDVFDESFGFFDLELDLDCSPTAPIAAQEPTSMSFDFATCQAAEPLYEEFEVRDPLKKKKKTPKTSSQRQREEIASLRVTAARLEQDLQRLKSASRQAPSTNKEERTTDDDDDDSTSMLASLWEAVAKRQEAEKLRAEQENVHLKQQLKANVAIAKSLERSLRKRKIMEL